MTEQSFKPHTDEQVEQAYGQESGAAEAVRRIESMLQTMIQSGCAQLVENDEKTIQLMVPGLKEAYPNVFGRRSDLPITFRKDPHGMISPDQLPRVEQAHDWVRDAQTMRNALPLSPEEQAEHNELGSRFDEIIAIYRKQRGAGPYTIIPEAEEVAAARILNMEVMLKEMGATDFIHIDRSDPRVIKVYAPDAKAEMPDAFGGPEPDMPISFINGKNGLLRPQQEERMQLLYDWMKEELLFRGENQAPQNGEITTGQHDGRLADSPTKKR